MYNIKPQIMNLLEEIQDVEVSFFYPQNWAKLPAVSYYEIGNVELARTDGEERLTEFNIQIDVWAMNSSETSNIALLVDEKMRSIGFKRSFAQDLFEENTGIYHKTMRYRGIVDNKTYFVYQ